MKIERAVLLVALALELFAAPLAAEAQPTGKVYRIGYLDPASSPRTLESDPFNAFLSGLREHGLVEGRNVVIERRYADNKGPERVRELAAELVAMKVDVIVTVTTQVARETKKVTTTVPVVMAVSADPIGGGVVQSLARPGGNVTGLSLTGPALTAKRMELLKEIAPHLARIVIVAPSELGVYPLYLQEAETAAPALGITEVRLVGIGSDPARWDEAFEAIGRRPGAGLVVGEWPAFAREGARMAALALKHKLPSAYGLKAHVEAGGLIFYGAVITDSYRRAAGLVSKVLMGAKPADLPVEEPTKFELVINMKTAKALGLTIPRSVLIRADQVIE
jgi:putative ABC transport system substrate-binding protein